MMTRPKPWNVNLYPCSMISYLNFTPTGLKQPKTILYCACGMMSFLKMSYSTWLQNCFQVTIPMICGTVRLLLPVCGVENWSQVTRPMVCNLDRILPVCRVENCSQVTRLTVWSMILSGYVCLCVHMKTSVKQPDLWSTILSAYFCLCALWVENLWGQNDDALAPVQ